MERFSLFFVLIYVCTGVCHAISNADPCNITRVLPELQHRGLNSTFGSDGRVIADRYIIPDGGYWYRVDGRQMLNNVTQVYPRMCGTDFPIYLKGDIPKQSDGIVERDACMLSFGSMCAQAIKIRIRSCGDHTAYYLQKPLISSSAYCFVPETTHLPPSVPKPSVNVSLVNKQSLFGEVQRLQFVCNFDSSQDDLYYQVFWSIDGITINETKIANRTNIDSLVLDEEPGQFERLGVHVACSVQTFFAYDNTPGPISPVSEQYYAGIKVPQMVTFYRHNPKAFITIKPTVPIGCPPSLGGACDVIVELIIPETYHCQSSVGAVQPVGSQTCGNKHISHDQWDQEYKLDIVYFDVQTYDTYDDNYYVSLRTANNYFHPIWGNVQLDDVRIHMGDDTHLWKGKECHAICDPHMLTFDGRAYENQNSGTFVLYENDDLERKVQIQMTVTECNSGGRIQPWCVCGIAVRAGADVFVIDRCPGIYRPIFEFRSCEDNILDVRKLNENLYKVYLPSGTYLSARLWYYSGKNVMDLHIYPSPADTHHTRGLCGTLNGKTDDDFTMPGGSLTADNNEFANSWSVIDDDNLLIMPNDTLAQLKSWNTTTHFCTCDAERNVSCTHNTIATCVKDGESPVIKQNRCRIHKSRVLRTLSPILPDVTVDTPSQVQQQVWNTSMATEYCQSFLKSSPSFDSCAKNVLVTNVQDSIDTCVLDIMYTQTTVWANSSREALKSVCLKELKQNTTYQNKDAHSQLSIADKIKDIICPNECTGNGICSNGTCSCVANFGGADCSIDLRRIPIIYGVNIDTNSTCDLQKCNMAVVEGETFIDSGYLTCHYQLYEISASGVETLYMNSTAAGQFNTLLEMFCPLPSLHHRRRSQHHTPLAYRWSVSVSNDGQHVGKASDVIIYNEKCQTIDKNGFKIQVKDNYCYIGGECVPEGSANLLNFCSVCNTGKSQIDWSLSNDYCLINGVCVANGTINKAHNSSMCYVGKSQDQWTAIPPSINKPQVNVTLVNKNSLFGEVQRLQFICNFETLVDDLYYQVIWYIDSKVVNVTKIANQTNIQDLELEETSGQFEHLGVNVACAVRAFFTPGGLPGPLSGSSEQFYAGIRVTPTVTFHRDNPYAYITVRPTVPIGCPQALGGVCDVVVELIIPETYHCQSSVGAVQPVGSQTCGNKRIRHDEWDQEHKMEVIYFDDQSYEINNNNYYVSLRTANNYFHPIWGNVQLDSVRVLLDDDTHIWKGKECHAICDPHMQTFDGRAYENQNSGTFVFYENDDAGRKVQVQMMVTECNNAAVIQPWCVCGIAVRAGGDVFVIDRCPGIYKPIFEFRSCEDNILDVRKINENLYKIYLPSGTYLSVSLWYYTGKNVMDLHMYPSSADTHHTRGLCGTLNGKTDDDFTDPNGTVVGDNNIFARSWRVSDEDNLIIMPNDTLSKLETWKSTVQFCTCDAQRNVSCSHNTIATCVKDNETPVMQTNRCRMKQSRSLRKVQVVHTSGDVVTRPQKTDAPQQVWDAASARAFCENFFSSSDSFKACSNHVSATNPKDSVDTCALDIMYTQTTTWASSSRESLKSVCLKELKQNTTYQQEDSADHPSIAQRIKEIACPKDCSDNGVCVNGTCICNNNFGAADCSLNPSVPPQIYGVNIDTNQTCDIQNCDMAVVEGEPFIDIASLTCHYQLFEISNTGTESFKMNLTTPGQFNTLVEVFCPRPKLWSKRKAGEKTPFAYRWSVGVSNDGHHVGETTDVILFNGECQTPDDEAPTVSLQDDYCFINGVCVQDGRTDYTDLCSMCKVNESNSTWSRNLDYCLINGVCFANGTVKSDEDCFMCNVGISHYEWSRNPDFCFVKGVCYANGYVNFDDKCSMCIIDKSINQWSSNPEYCRINQQCVASVVPSDGYDCLYNNMGYGKFGWSNQTDNLKCAGNEYYWSCNRKCTLKPPDMEISGTETSCDVIRTNL